MRFSSSHPKDLSDELIEVVASSPKIANHLHLAVQSGDDDILHAMNRHYSVAHYQELIKKIRSARPGIAITTDVIVGFPGESEAQFNNTVALFEDIKFELAYVARYSPRPGTASWKMADDVSRLEKKRREKILNDKIAAASLEVNQKLVGQEILVLVDGVNEDGRYYGKTSDYKTVFFNAPDSDSDLIGTFVPVMVDEALNFGLIGSYQK